MKIKCLRDVHNRRSLIKGKIYEARQGQKNWFALVDESGEEYAYPPELFEVVESSEDRQIIYDNVQVLHSDIIAVAGN